MSEQVLMDTTELQLSEELQSPTESNDRDSLRVTSDTNTRLYPGRFEQVANDGMRWPVEKYGDGILDGEVNPEALQWVFRYCRQEYGAVDYRCRSILADGNKRLAGLSPVALSRIRGFLNAECTRGKGDCSAAVVEAHEITELRQAKAEPYPYVMQEKKWNDFFYRLVLPTKRELALAEAIQQNPEAESGQSEGDNAGEIELVRISKTRMCFDLYIVSGGVDGDIEAHPKFPFSKEISQARGDHVVCQNRLTTSDSPNATPYEVMWRVKPKEYGQLKLKVDTYSVLSDGDHGETKLSGSTDITINPAQTPTEWLNEYLGKRWAEPFTKFLIIIGGLLSALLAIPGVRRLLRGLWRRFKTRHEERQPTPPADS